MIDKKLGLGVIFLGLIAALIIGTVAVYHGALRSSTALVVETDRAGLTLTAGAPVKLRGVDIGRVGRIITPRQGDDHVQIELEISNDQFRWIPANVTAQIVPPTAFGAKYIQLSTDDSSGPAAKAGAVIPATRVTVEVDQTFENLTKVLTAARPAQVNEALSAVAQSVDQRGQLLGDLITQTDNYLASFNPFLNTLNTDVTTGRSVLDTYTRATPDLVSLASSAGTTSNTLVNQQASLRALELSLTSFSTDTRRLLGNVDVPLTQSVRLLAPVSGVLAKYSPEFQCTFLGLASANKLAEAVVGGTNPGISTITRVVPARQPYKYGTNLPKVGDQRGPSCYGLPYVTPKEGLALDPAPNFINGADPYAGRQPNPAENALTTLFGLLAGAGNLP
ncbi:MAG: MCE family protein [Acidimicrobiales bacterium]